MRFKIIASLLGAMVALLGIIAVILIIRSPFSLTSTLDSKQASISGTFDINGVIPPGASISLTQRLVTDTNKAQIFASNLPVSDRNSWSFSRATANKSYEIQALVIVNGKTVTTSNILIVTAPADDETLSINLGATNQPGSAVISGNIDVNGYIPQGATITIEGRKLGSQKFTAVARNLKGQSKQFLSYATAVPGVMYEIQGILLDQNGTVIGNSNILTVAAPALNETLTINSSAAPAIPTPIPTTVQAQNTPTPQPASTQAVISGNINLNGAAPGNSRIVIFQKTLNSSSYVEAVDNITPTDGTSWTWNGAQSSTWYTMIAVLKQRNSNGTDTDIATSAPTTVAAPANNVIFTLNSGYSLSAPSGSITVTCQTYNGGPNQNTWNAQINFQSVPGAQSYWYQVGNTNGGNNITNTANQTNNASTQTLNVVLNNNTTYYARYSYANVPVAPLGSSQYSPFSSGTAIQCSN